MSVVTSLDAYRRARDPDVTRATVLTDVDPDNPDCAWHLVVHENRNAVQMESLGLVAGVESFGSGGHGSIDGPHRRYGKYFAIVKTVRYPEIV